ncbi:MAG: type I restriction enzyme HsdR N-terminal domain-containing protein [Paludibacteraceae bacterium]
MWQLNLPTYQFRIKQTEKGYFILDTFRRRYVKVTPEEWVRQHFLRFLTEVKGYPSGLIVVEKQLELNGMTKRCDAVLFDLQGIPKLLIELKAPDVPITQAVFDQVAVYNTKLNVEFFMVSNGLNHYCYKVNSENTTYDFLDGIPDYQSLMNF